MGAGEAVQRSLSRTMRWSAAHAWLVVSLVALTTLMAGLVLVAVEPNVETDVQAGYFGVNDAQANAFRELRREVAGVNSEIVYFELKDGARGVDPESGQTRAVTDVHDPIALRAQEELFTFVKAEFAARTGEDKVISHTSLPYFEKLIYAQFPGGCFCLAPTQAEHDAAQELLSQADTTGAISLYNSTDGRAAVMFIIYDPDTSVLSKKETGGLINEIIADYRELPLGRSTDHADVPRTYDLWEPAYFDSWGVQSWIYRIDEQVQDESVIFVGAVMLFLVVTLMALFRNAKRALIGVGTVAIILLWTLAGMTIGGVSVGFVSMAMFPLLLGVGVDYVIHIINEFGAERAQTGSSDEAFDLIGRRGAVALLISTVTTITGFVVMISSTSPMIVEIGAATILGIFSVFLLSVTFLPAMLHLTVRDEATEVFRPGAAIGAAMGFFGRAKPLTITILVAGTIGTAIFIPATEYVVGTVEVNLPQKELWTHDDDKAHMLVMYERFQDTIKASGQETVITMAREPCPATTIPPTEPCGLATKAAVDDMIRIHKAMVAQPFVQEAGGAVNSVPFILNLYALLDEGIQTAAPGLLDQVVQGGAFLPCEDFPPGVPCGIDPAYDQDFGLIADWNDQDVLAAYNDMVAREEWQPLLLTFMDETYSIAWALTFVSVELDQDAAVKADAAFAAVVEDAAPRSTDNHYFGTLTGIKKYNDYTDFWLTLSTTASVLIVCALVLLFTRSLRAMFAVATPMVLTFVWWLGTLPMPIVDIDLAFIFMIPIAFITSLGSDYAVHLAWNLEQRDAKVVFRTVGKAVLYSGFTTFVSFLFFTRGAIRGSYEMFQAACIAIALMTFLTLVTIPMFYVGKGKKAAPDSAQDSAPDSAHDPAA